jgi:hypothetical protein
MVPRSLCELRMREFQRVDNPKNQKQDSEEEEEGAAGSRDEDHEKGWRERVVW